MCTVIHVMPNISFADRQAFKRTSGPALTLTNIVYPPITYKVQFFSAGIWLSWRKLTAVGD